MSTTAPRPSRPAGNLSGYDWKFPAGTATRARAGAMTPSAEAARPTPEISPRQETCMAGRRRTIGRRGGDGRVRPVVPVERASRIHSSALARYAVAQTARDRLAVAMDYARAAAAAAARAGVEDADAAVEDGARELFALGDKLTKALAKQGGAR